MVLEQCAFGLGFIGRQATRMQRRLMIIRDERSTAVTELLGGIKAVKMYAWECSFFSRISAIRERELRALRVYWRFLVASRTQWLATPIGVSIATFGCYVWLHGVLDAATAFTAIALFNILRFPMQLLPMTTNNTLEARVALARMQEFLDQPEAVGLLSMEKTGAGNGSSIRFDSNSRAVAAVGRGEGGMDEQAKGEGYEDFKLLPAIQVEAASFAWPSGTPLLTDISFHCRKGAADYLSI